MFTVKKKQGKEVCAYQLGDDTHPVIRQLIAQGKLSPLGKGSYAIHSQEAILGGGGGQIALAGDYIKLDSTNTPYPNSKAWFQAHHRPLGGDRYEQLPELLAAWDVQEPEDAAVQFLICEKGLTLHPDDPAHYFTAPLWGTHEAAARDAVIIFYSITKDADGTITDAAFNFVERTEFEKTYDRV